MITDFFFHRCTIYRLNEFPTHDFSASEEGEVTEEWGVVASNVPCCFEPEDTAYQRRSDGVADIGTHTMFIGKNADIQNADRIYWASSEFGAAFYTVKMVKPIRDFSQIMHHKEVKLEHIDWVAPVYVTAWEAS